METHPDTHLDRAVNRLLAASGARPRSDARQNLRRLVEAAERAVAEVGIDAGAHDIAGRAGVGIGTFYRRVPSREALLEAVLVETVADIVTLAEQAAAADDAAHGFRSFAARYVELRTASCGLHAALGGTAAPILRPQLARLRALLRRIVAAAQQAGALRADVSWQDVAFLLASVTPDAHTIGLRAGTGQWRRTLDVLLDGLTPGASAGGAAALPVAVPAQ